MSEVIRLESNETESTISNLSNYETDISKSLTDMSEVMGKLTSCLEGEVADSIAGKFSEYEDQFPFINESIQSYVKDFKNLEDEWSEEYNIGDRIGQIIILPYPQVNFIEAEELSKTERGDGGYGSSGV